MRSSLVSSLPAAALLAGCATYDSGLDFQPRPCAAQVRGPDGHAGRVEATVLGVREGGRSTPASVDVKVRVERFGALPVAVPAENLRLMTGDRETLEACDVKPIGPAVAASGGAATFQATFALPGRDPASFDLSDLDLLVPVDVDGRRQTVTLAFQRGETSYLWADPWNWPGEDYSGNPTGWRR